MRATRRQTARAMDLHATWRREGHPGLITGHEAWTLSGGIAGCEGDHTNPVPLASVAMAVATHERNAR